MKTEELIKRLRIPLYKLYYVDNIDKFVGLKKDEIDGFRKDYSQQEIKDIINALKWAVENPTFDFQSLLPNLPQGNELIYKYLCRLYDQLSSTF
jgi:hypothetical protein